MKYEVSSPKKKNRGELIYTTLQSPNTCTQSKDLKVKVLRVYRI